MTTPLIPAQRREIIEAELRRSPVLGIRQLTGILGVSHMTVRRDIAELEQAGVVVSVAGGVRLAGWHDAPTVGKSLRGLSIASAAAQMVSDNSVVYVGAGPCANVLATAVSQRTGVTVISNSMDVVGRLVGSGSGDVVYTGGRVDRAQRSSDGMLAASVLAQLNIDLAFVPGPLWDAHRGMTAASEDSAALTIAVLQASVSTVLLAPGEGFGRSAAYRVAPLTDFDSIVTDASLPQLAVDRVSTEGVRLLVAESQPAEQGRIRQVSDDE